MQKQLQEQQKVQQQIEQLELLAKQHMTPEAVSRYGNLKVAHTEKAIQSIAMVVQLVQQGKIHEKLTDDMYKNLLLNITPEKKGFKITRK